MIGYKQSNIFPLLNSDIENNKVNHCYIFYGNSEQIIEQYALNFAQHLLCRENGGKPCGLCNACSKVFKNIHSDVFVYPKDDKLIKTEDSKEIVNESLIKPLEANYKVFILNKFQGTTVSAQNKLLKTLEEPSTNVVFIITTTQINTVLDTIKSRSKKIYVSDFNSVVDEIKSIKKGDELVTDALINILVTMKKSNEVLFYSNKLMELNVELLYIIAVFQQLLNDIIKLLSSVSENFVNNSDKLNELKIISNIFTLNGLTQIFNYLEMCVTFLKNNCNKNAVLESILLKILEVKHKCQN